MLCLLTLPKLLAPPPPPSPEILQADAHAAARDTKTAELAELRQRLNVVEEDYRAAKEELAIAGEATTTLGNEARELRDLAEGLRAELQAMEEQALAAETAAERGARAVQEEARAAVEVEVGKLRKSLAEIEAEKAQVRHAGFVAVVAFFRCFGEYGLEVGRFGFRKGE